MEALVGVRAQGFSLVELMVVIAIVAILATVSVISYKTYSIRSRISSLITVANNVKTEVEASHNQGIIFGASSSQTYIASNASNKPSGLYSMSQVAYGCVNIDLDLTALNLDGTKTLMITWCPTEDNGSIQWRCGYDSTSYSSYLTYLPSNCQSVNTAIQNTSF